MLELCSVRPFDVAQRRVGLDDAARHEVIQLECQQVLPPFERTYAQQILVLPQPIQIAPAEWEGTKVLGDDVEQVLGRRKPEVDVGGVGLFGVVGRLELGKSVYAFQEPAALTSSRTYPFPVLPNVSMANTSPSSILVWSPPLTIGTLLPPWMLYRPMLCPLRLRMHLTGSTFPPMSSS